MSKLGKTIKPVYTLRNNQIVPIDTPTPADSPAAGNVPELQDKIIFELYRAYKEVPPDLIDTLMSAIAAHQAAAVVRELNRVEIYEDTSRTQEYLRKRIAELQANQPAEVQITGSVVNPLPQNIEPLRIEGGSDD